MHQNLRKITSYLKGMNKILKRILNDETFNFSVCVFFF